MRLGVARSSFKVEYGGGVLGFEVQGLKVSFGALALGFNNFNVRWGLGFELYGHKIQY